MTVKYGGSEGPNGKKTNCSNDLTNSRIRSNDLANSFEGNTIFFQLALARRRSEGTRVLNIYIRRSKYYMECSI